MPTRTTTMQEVHGQLPKRAKHEPFLLGVIIAGVLSFVTITYAVHVGWTSRFDEDLMLSTRNPADLKDAIGPEWVEELMRDCTAIGGFLIVSLVTIAVASFLGIRRKTGALTLVLAAVVGGQLLSLLLKGVIDRARPAVVPHLSYHSTASFPSGHSMLSAIAYLTLGTLLAGLVHERSLKIFFVVFAVLLTLLVGVSRVYLGVHWPTDVLAGWSLGMAWAMLCHLVAVRLKARGAVEASVD